MISKISPGEAEQGLCTVQEHSKHQTTEVGLGMVTGFTEAVSIMLGSDKDCASLAVSSGFSEQY